MKKSKQICKLYKLDQSILQNFHLQSSLYCTQQEKTIKKIYKSFIDKTKQKTNVSLIVKNHKISQSAEQIKRDQLNVQRNNHSEQLQAQAQKFYLSIIKHMDKINKHQKIRIGQWLKVLNISIYNQTWKQNRNLYLQVLSIMIQKGQILQPFTNIPKDGPLPKLNYFDIPIPIRGIINQSYMTRLKSTQNNKRKSTQKNRPKSVQNTNKKKRSISNEKLFQSQQANQNYIDYSLNKIKKQISSQKMSNQRTKLISNQDNAYKDIKNLKQKLKFMSFEQFYKTNDQNNFQINSSQSKQNQSELSLLRFQPTLKIPEVKLYYQNPIKINNKMKKTKKIFTMNTEQDISLNDIIINKQNASNNVLKSSSNNILKSSKNNVQKPSNNNVQKSSNKNVFKYLSKKIQKDNMKFSRNQVQYSDLLIRLNPKLKQNKEKTKNNNLFQNKIEFKPLSYNIKNELSKTCVQTDQFLQFLKTYN